MAKTKELRENRQPSMFEDEKMPLRAKDWWKYLISLFLLIVYLFPFYIIINVSLRSFSDTTSRIRFPNPIYWDNFNKVIESGEIFTGIKNCLIITALVLLLEIVVGCMAAYALARNQSKLNEVVRSLIMSVMMITPLTILVGIYSTMSTIHATSTYWGMVLVLSAFGLPLVIFLYTNCKGWACGMSILTPIISCKKRLCGRLPLLSRRFSPLCPMITVRRLPRR